MAINKNHEFEELDGVKCGIVEKNVQQERVVFLKNLLEYNGFKVKIVPSPAPKAAAPAKIEEGVSDPAEPASNIPEIFTVGVTDYTFNPINAIFGRLLKTTDGHVVTLGFWQQKESISNDEVPYFGDKAG
ncbi:MAG: hypothetical protein ABIO04_10630 [Ferruginibacter sp.]